MKTIPIVPARSCGTCSLCCKVMGVQSLGKPRDVWCSHARPGSTTSCSIYQTDAFPKDCREFVCGWLERPDVFPDSMRPDRIGVVITGVVAKVDGVTGYSLRDGILLHVDPGWPTAWREHGPLRRMIEHLALKGVPVIVGVGKKRHSLVGRRYVTFTTDEIPDRQPEPLKC